MTDPHSRRVDDPSTAVFRFLLERGYAADTASNRTKHLVKHMPAPSVEYVLASGGSSKSVADALGGMGAQESSLPFARRIGNAAASLLRYRLFDALTNLPHYPGALVGDLPALRPVTEGLVPIAVPVAAGLEIGKGVVAGGVLVGALGASQIKDLYDTLKEAPEWPVINKRSNDTESSHSVAVAVGDDHPPDILELASRVECIDEQLWLIITIRVRDPDTWGNDTGVEMIEAWAKDLDCGTAAKKTLIVEEGSGDAVMGNSGQILEKEIRIEVECDNAFRSEAGGSPKFAYAVRAKDFNGNSTSISGICSKGVKKALADCCEPESGGGGVPDSGSEGASGPPIGDASISGVGSSTSTGDPVTTPPGN